MARFNGHMFNWDVNKKRSTKKPPEPHYVDLTGRLGLAAHFWGKHIGIEIEFKLSDVTNQETVNIVLTSEHHPSKDLGEYTIESLEDYDTYLRDDCTEFLPD